MKVLLFGKNGQVGWELNRSLQPLGEIVALDRSDADFSNPESLREIIQNIKPDIIVNAVAFTAVDKAEAEEELAEKINGLAPGVLADEAIKLKALLVHYSTDYVFNGAKDSAYLEIDDTCPINAYGRTKLSGEQAIQSSGCEYLVFRTSWVYASRGYNFLLTILKLAKERENLSIVSDQIGSPTTARLIADITLVSLQQSIKERELGDFSSDLYHLSASGYASWYDFAQEIVNAVKQQSGEKLKIKDLKKIPSVDYPTPARRPNNSRLMLKKLEDKFGVDIPDWKNVLELCLEELSS